MTNLNKTASYLIALAIGLPIAIYLLCVWYFSESLFYADDFHLLKTVLWIQEVPGFAEKAKLLYQQHQEHRIVVPRLLTLFDYFIEGHINWKTLIFFANLLWCATLLLLWKGFSSLKIQPWYFLPVPWLLLHPQYHDNVTWAISILQQSDIVFLFTLLAYLYSKKSYQLAVAVSLIATFTHGNGIFSFPIGIVFLLVDRNWKGAITLVTIMLAVALFYFYDFKAGQNASISRSLADPANLLQSFGVFFGGITLIFLNNYVVAAAFGITGIGVLIAWSIVSLKSELSDQTGESLLFDKMLWGITAFLVITGSLVVATRSWMGVETIAAPRYLHYPSYVACLVYLTLLRIATPRLRRPLGLVFFPLSVVLCLLSYFNFTPYLHLLRDRLIADQSNYQHHRVFLEYFPSFNQNIEKTYEDAISKGIVRMSDPLGESIISEANRPDIRLAISSDTFGLADVSGVTTVQVARIQGQRTSAAPMFVTVRSDRSHVPYWIPVYTQRAAYRTLVTTGDLRGTNFEATVILDNLPPGAHQLGIWEAGRLSWTSTYLTVPTN